ncbi:MAG: hypothetical protein AAF862_11970 [Pseudomonadota bacterium]
MSNANETQLTCRTACVCGYRILATAVLVFSASCFAATSHCAAADFSVVAGAELSSGTFGAEQNTDIFIATADIEAIFDGWQARLSVPYVRVEGPAAFIAPGFTVTSISAGLEPIRTVTVIETQQTQTSEGLGDVRVAVSRGFVLPYLGVLIDVSLAVKLPTGDVDQLLSTGEADGSLDVDVIKRLGDFSISAGLGYTMSGRSSRFDVQDRTRASLSFYRGFYNGTGVGLAADWRQAVISGLDDVKELSVYFSAPLGDQFSVLGYALTGFSDTSPDVGGGLRLRADF